MSERVRPGSFQVEDPREVPLRPGSVGTSFQQRLSVTLAGSCGVSFDADGDDPARRGTISTASAAASMVTTMIGAGVLAFPGLFKQAGWIVAPILMFMAYIVNVQMNLAIVSAAELCVLQGKRASSLEDMAEAAWGPGGRVLVSTCVNVLLLLINSIFLVLIGSNMVIMFKLRWTKEQLGDRIELWAVVVGAVLVSPLCMLRDVSKISKAAVIGVVASVMYIVLIVFAGAAAASSGKKREFRRFPERWLECGPVLSTMIFGFFLSMMVPRVRSSMQQPQDLPRCLWASLTFVGACYLVVGSVGYAGWGADVEGMVTENMVGPDGSPTKCGVLLSVSVIANLLVTYPLLHNVVTTALEEKLGGRYNVALRVALLCSSVATYLVLPCFVEMVQIVSSLFMPLLGIFLPVAFYHKLSAPGTSGALVVAYQLGATTIRVHGACLVVGFLACACGLWNSVGDMANVLQKPAIQE